jgi:hypothetical protein
LQDPVDLVQFHATKALCRVFVHFMETGDLSHWKKLESKKKQKRLKLEELTKESTALLEIRKWIRKRYLKYLNILFNFFQVPNPGLQVTFLTLFYIKAI